MIRAALSALLLAPAGVAAQEGTREAIQEITGVVRGAAGLALEGAVVEIPGARMVTSARGVFVLQAPPADSVELRVRAVGFAPHRAWLVPRQGRYDFVVVQMETTAQQLARIAVEAAPYRRATGIEGFNARMARGGSGQFITRGMILERNASRLSDVMRNLRGVRVVGGRVRFATYSGNRGTVCQPDIWLDGSVARGMEADDVPATDVEGVELYTNFSTIPFEFTPTGATAGRCGTIVIWTRTPNKRW